MNSRNVTLGIDIGGTKIAAGLVDLNGGVLHAIRRVTRPTLLLPDILSCCRELLAEARVQGLQPLGIGVGAKGAVDRQARRLVHSLYLGRENVGIGEALARAFGLIVEIENDVHAATIGEMVFGAGRTCRDFLFLNAGTGISAGIVNDGRLYRGSSGAAGESGHVSMDGSGRFICKCGLSGCMETIIVDGRGGARLPAIRFSDANDPMFTSPYALVAAGLVDWVNLLGPEVVVLAGGMLLNNPEATDWLIGIIREHALPDAAAMLRTVVRAHAGNMTGLVGAAALPLHHNPVPRFGATESVCNT